MTSKTIWRPHQIFFSAGQTGTGIIVLLLQVSVLFWPVAVRLARRLEEEQGVQDMLDRFTKDYQHGHVIAPPQKRFRPLAGS